MRYHAHMRPLALLLLLLPVTYSQSTKLPAFKEFATVEAFSGKPAAPVLRTPDQRMFRTMIREGAAKGPNFAGHYSIADWGCGAGCVTIVVVDAKDGRIYDAPFKDLSWSLVKYEGKIASNTPEFEPLEFYTDSRLLIARGCPEDENCASYFYEWVAPKFRLIRKVAATPIPQ